MQPESGRAGNLFGRLLVWRRAALVPLVGLFLLSILIGTTSCGQRPTGSTATAPAAPRVVRVACPGEPAATVVTRYGQAWVNAQRRLEVVRYDAAKGPDKQLEADVWILPPADMPRWAAADALHHVPESYTAKEGDYAWNKILPIYANKLLIWDGKPYALPLLGDAYLCFYRQDLLEDAHLREAFRSQHHRDMTAPATWEEFADLAEYFARVKLPGHSLPQPSLPPLPARDEDLDREFYTVAVPFARRAYQEDQARDHDVLSFHYDLETMAVRIDKPGFVYALQLLKRLQTCRPSGSVAEPATAFEKGDAVLCQASPSWIPRFQKSSQTAGKFGFCRLPGSRTVFDFATDKPLPQREANYVPYLGANGWVGVVPRSCQQPDAAFALLASLSDVKTSRDVVIEPAWGGGVYRLEHLDPQMGWQTFGLGPKQTAALVECLRQTIAPPRAQNPVVRLRIPEQRSHQEALVAEVRAALIDGKDARQALAAAAQRWRELDATRSAEQRRTEYRLSLSLGGNN